MPIRCNICVLNNIIKITFERGVEFIMRGGMVDGRKQKWLLKQIK